MKGGQDRRRKIMLGSDRQICEFIGPSLTKYKNIRLEKDQDEWLEFPGARKARKSRQSDSWVKKTTLAGDSRMKWERDNLHCLQLSP